MVRPNRRGLLSPLESVSTPEARTRSGGAGSVLKQVLVLLLVMNWGPSVCRAQVWAHGISPQRAPNQIGHLPPTPSRPSLPLPKFSPHNILPEPMHFNVVPMENFRHENLRPSHLDRRVIEMEAIVKEKIAPERLPRTIEEGSARLGREIVAPRETFGSTIFFPAMTLPHSLRHKDKMNQGDMVISHERRALGW